MLILKRLAVWALEMLAVTLLLGILLYVSWGPYPGPGQHDFLRDVARYTAVTAVVFMFGSAYLLTTATFGIVLRGQRLWLYPLVAALLFVIHLQFYASGWTSSQKLPIQVFGACIVVACTLAGGWLLRRWVQAGSGARPDLPMQS